MARRILLVLALLANHVRADETPQQPAPQAEPVLTEPQPAPQPEPVAPEPDWSRAPRPDEASGVEHEAATPVQEHLLWIPRTILLVPRWVVWSVSQPVRGGAYVYERYDLPGVFRRTFFNVSETFGIYPIATYETTFGVTMGARLVHRDLFGEHERLKLRANWGGRYQQAYGINVRSGRRIPHLSLELDGSYERRPDEPFYGIGNDADMETRFQEDLVRSVLTLDAPIVDALSFRVETAVVNREVMGMRVDNTRVEGQLVYDSRQPSSIYANKVLDATGWFASVYGGFTRGIGDDPSRFTSYGTEVQRFLDLYHGTRVLALRLLVEEIRGTASFIDLPRLGGTEFLRGYPSGRFRDNALALATAEYTWDLGNFFAAYTFVDAGRVYPSLGDFTFEDLRIGYGIGVELHTDRAYIGRVQVAASRDGDFLLDLVLSPAFPRRERVGRY